MLLLDITVVVVALPSMQQRFDASLTGLQWVVDAYALSLAALILTAGALADRYGRRLVFIAGVVLFTLSSLLCGLAWSIVALDVARALQGIGGAALFATALALIGHEYRGPDRYGALAGGGATVGAAVVCGPLVGGLLTDGLGWRWIFFVNIPVGVFALAVALTRISESRDEGARHTDVRGLVTFAAALFLIVFGILRGNASGWTSTVILMSLVGGVLLLVLFVAVEMRQDRPMFDMTLFRQRAFLGVSIATFCIAAGMFAMFPYLSIYLQDILGYSPLATGVRFLPLTAFVFFVPLATRRVAARLPLRIMISAGLGLVAAGLALMYGLEADSGWTALLAGFVAGGIGIGIRIPRSRPVLFTWWIRRERGWLRGSATPSASQAWQSGSPRSEPYSEPGREFFRDHGRRRRALPRCRGELGRDTSRRRSTGSGRARKDGIRERPQRRAPRGLVAARGRRNRRGAPSSQPSAGSRSGDRERLRRQEGSRGHRKPCPLRVLASPATCSWRREAHRVRPWVRPDRRTSSGPERSRGPQAGSVYLSRDFGEGNFSGRGSQARAAITKVVQPCGFAAHPRAHSGLSP